MARQVVFGGRTQTPPRHFTCRFIYIKDLKFPNRKSFKVKAQNFPTRQFPTKLPLNSNTTYTKQDGFLGCYQQVFRIRNTRCSPEASARLRRVHKSSKGGQAYLSGDEAMGQNQQRGRVALSKGCRLFRNSSTTRNFQRPFSIRRP